MANEPGPMLGQGRTAEVLAWGDGQVLKLMLAEFGRDVEKEMLATGAVHDAGLPVPAVEGMVEVRGRQGIVMERVDGPSMLEAFLSRPWNLVRMARLLAELHVQVHSCQAVGLASHREKTVDEIQRRARLKPPVLEAVLEVLRQLPDGTAVCHGDFHPGNIIMSGRGPVIIDWVDARRGNPLADVTRTWLMFKKAFLPDEMAGALRRVVGLVRACMWPVYLRRYRQLRPFLASELVAWRIPMVALRLAEGIPEERESLVAFLETSLRRQGYLRGSVQ